MTERLALFMPPLWWGALSAVIGLRGAAAVQAAAQQTWPATRGGGAVHGAGLVSLGCGALLLLVLRGRAGGDGGACPHHDVLRHGPACCWRC